MKLSQRIRTKALVFATYHRVLVACAAGLIVMVMLLIVIWFIAFSGMNEPVQFVYDSF